MAKFYASTFLTPILPGEDFIKLRDDSGSIRYKIYNNSISSYHQVGNIIIIKTDSDKKILRLEFISNQEASTALPALIERYKQIKKTHQEETDAEYETDKFALLGDEKRRLIFDINELEQDTTTELSIGKGSRLMTDFDLKQDKIINITENFYFATSVLTKLNVTDVPNQDDRIGIVRLVVDLPNNVASVTSGKATFPVKDAEIEFNFKPIMHMDDDFKIILGWFDDAFNTSAGYTLMYDTSVNQTQFLTKGTSNNLSTLHNTMTGVTQDWIKVRMKIQNGIGQTYIDGNLIDVMDTNIPIDDEYVQFGIILKKIDGVNQINLLLDRIDATFKIN